MSPYDFSSFTPDKFINTFRATRLFLFSHSSFFFDVKKDYDHKTEAVKLDAKPHHDFSVKHCILAAAWGL